METNQNQRFPDAVAAVERLILVEQDQHECEHVRERDRNQQVVVERLRLAGGQKFKKLEIVPMFAASYEAFALQTAEHCLVVQ